MFEHLADLEPPTPGDTERAAVQRRTDGLRQRAHRQRTAAIGTVVVLIAIAGTVAFSRDTSTQRVATGSTGPASNASGTPISPGDAAAQCFAQIAPDNGQRPTPTVTNWPTGLAPLLAVGSGGRLFVLRDGNVEEWTSGHEGPMAEGVRWARWAPDGSIYASRFVDGPRIEIDRFTAIGQATKAFDLPFTVSSAAPPGVCPIDGPFETFTLGTNGFVFPHHLVGPLPTGCPSGHQGSSCTFPEGTSLDEYSLDGQQGGNIGVFPERMSLGGESADGSSIIQVREDFGHGIVERITDPAACCTFDLPGQAFALSPDGSELAAVEGTQVIVANVASSTASTVRYSDIRPFGRALAWSGDTIAVAHGNGVALILPGFDYGVLATLDVFEAGPITCLDFAS